MFSLTGTGVEVIGTPDWDSDGGFTFQIDGDPEQIGSAHGDRKPGTMFVRIQDLPNKEHTFSEFILANCSDGTNRLQF